MKINVVTAASKGVVVDFNAKYGWKKHPATQGSMSAKKVTALKAVLKNALDGEGVTYRIKLPPKDVYPRENCFYIGKRIFSVNSAYMYQDLYAKMTTT